MLLHTVKERNGRADELVKNVINALAEVGSYMKWWRENWDKEAEEWEANVQER